VAIGARCSIFFVGPNIACVRRVLCDAGSRQSVMMMMIEQLNRGAVPAA
jgi:hypothetical protein